MASQLHSFIDIEPVAKPGSLPRTARSDREHSSSSSSPTAIELDALTFGTRYNGPAAESEPGIAIAQPGDYAEIEPLSRAVEVTQSLTNPARNRWRFVSACTMLVQMGLNDSAPGALIPYLERYYAIDYATVSLIFVANAIGFILAACVTNRLHTRLGRGKVMMLGMLCTTVSYVLAVATPPYALVVVSFFLAGLGNGLALALANGFIAGLANATVLLGICHGSYGIGGILGPLIATGIVGAGHRWSVFYFLPLAFSVVNGLAAPLTFRNIESDSTNTTAGHQPQASLLQALKSRVVLLGAAFIFFYQGAEVTISGWVLSFLLTSRAHTASQSISLGYITSGFWGGITLGRLVLSPPAQRCGEKVSIAVMLVAATLFQFIVWFVPNVLAEAVAVAIVGLLLGPVYPCATVVFSKLLTREQLVPALSIVTAVGSSGGAAGPFVTGVIGQKTGPWVLNPIVVSLVALMLGCWVGLPRIVKRTD